MSDNKVVKLKPKTKKGGKCPICTKAVAAEYKPFCSKRCADLDLGKWLGDGYSIPTEEVGGFDGNYDGEE